MKTKGYVYSGGGRLATQTVAAGSDATQIESTNPVTGATLSTDVNGIGFSQVEPDPLGRDLISVPDSTIAVDPVASSKWNDPMPIEYTGGPTAEYQQANANWAQDMALRSLGVALTNHFKATTHLLLEKNPNIGIRTSVGNSLYGNDAANYLDSFHGEYLGGDTLIAEDASVGATQPQKTNILPLPDIPSSLEFLLRRGDCGTFVQKLINQLGTMDNPFSSDYLPDLLSGVKIDFSQQYDSNGNPVAGRAYARDKNGVGKLGLSPTDASGLTPYGYRQDTYEYVETVIHELIHFSGSKGRYTDREVVLALDAMGAIPDGNWRKAFTRLSKDDVHGNSGFFDGILRLHCAGPPVRPRD